MVMLNGLELNDTKSKEITNQGVVRRVSLIAASISELFSVLPPATESIPEKSKRELATLLLHSNILNTFGLLDCWAHIWVNEYGVKHKNGRQLHNSEIGLGPKCKIFRRSLPSSLGDYLSQRNDWIERISKLRHSLAHRVPPYIPPHMVDPGNEKMYNRLNADWFSTLDSNARGNLETELNNISHFKAWLIYDLEESPPIAFHAQLIVNFLTIEELSNIFLSEIRKRNIRRLRNGKT